MKTRIKNRSAMLSPLETLIRLVARSSCDAGAMVQDSLLSDLAGCFVVEIGERQAWSFVGFCDNRPTTPKEVRLYLDAIWRLDPDGVGTAAVELVRLAQLNGLMVTAAQHQPDGSLRLVFRDEAVFTVSGTANVDTVGEPWWFGPWTDSVT